MKNYYDELEVSKTASKEVIEKVYKVLAKKYHPDMNQDSNKAEAEEKFKKISEAYETLSDNEKRKLYDIELERTNPTISYDEYIDIVNQNKNLNNQLNNIINEFKVHTNNTRYNVNNNYQGYTNPRQTQYNNVNYKEKETQQNNHETNSANFSNKRTYYYTDTGKQASFFDYIKFKIKKFISNAFLLFLSIIAVLLIINAFLKFNIFSLFIK